MGGNSRTDDFSEINGKLDIIDLETDKIAGEVVKTAAIQAKTDLIGTAADSHTAATIFGSLDTLKEHIHVPSSIYPTQGAGGAGWVQGISLQANATAGTFGSVTEIVPINIITSDFDIHSINFDTITDNGIYEIVLYSNSGGTDEIGRTRFTRTSVQDVANDAVITTGKSDKSGVPIPANSGVWGKLCASANTTGIIRVSLRYHTY